VGPEGPAPFGFGTAPVKQAPRIDREIVLPARAGSGKLVEFGNFRCKAEREDQCGPKGARA